MAVIVTRMTDIDGDPRQVEFANADGYFVEDEMLIITKDGQDRATFKRWEDVIITDEALATPDTKLATADHG